MDPIDAVVAIASDLTSALSSHERYHRLLDALHRVIPFDAAALLRLDDDQLVPIVSKGLSEDAMGRRFSLREHPRLEIICRSDEPVLFPADTKLPDPYDGLLAGDDGTFTRIHACLGCPLEVKGELIGVLTADAAEPHAFDGIDRTFLAAVGALAAAELRTTDLIEALEQNSERQGLIARDLMRDAQLRRGTDMIGTSAPMQRLRRDIELVARSDYAVLITGETGVGKELAAREIHAASWRHAEPMLYVNCAALPESLAESELFGHVRGAFTGAAKDRAGKFEVARGGTLFLDEIGELPASVQPKLLRAIHQGEIQRVGSDQMIASDVRVIAATNRDLEHEVEAGRFRMDLFHRLNVYPIRVPPLRDRADDIPLLAGYFCDVSRRRLGIGPVRLEPDAIAALKRYAWPGNVRELDNLLSRITLKTAATVPHGDPVVLTRSDLGPEFGDDSTTPRPGLSIPDVSLAPAVDLKTATQDFQRRLIRKTLAAHHHNWAAAGRALGIHRSNFHRLAVRLGLK